MKILDATCGFKGIWYQKNHPFVTFMDKRKELVKCISVKDQRVSHKRFYHVNPKVVSEWKDAPFPNNYFDMVIFDPPHLIISRDKKNLAAMEKQYGHLYKDNWRKVLKEGIQKLFDILKPEGVFILKWCENSVPVEEVIALMPYKPLFGSNTKSKGHTANFWILFLKYSVDGDLNKY